MVAELCRSIQDRAAPTTAASPEDDTADKRHEPDALPEHGQQREAKRLDTREVLPRNGHVRHPETHRWSDRDPIGIDGEPREWR